MKPFYEVEKIIDEWLEQYQEIHDLKEDKNCYAHDILCAVNEGKMSKIEMLRDTQSLFLAGVDTTSRTLEEGFFYLAKHQDVQQRLYDELNQYRQKYGQFSLDNINELHTLRAVVYETLRRQVHAGNSFPKYVKSHNMTIAGYNVPKGCTIMGNHYYINHSSKYWQDPMHFHIEHFLDENNKFKLNRNLITFGFGKRDCMGQTLAIKNLNLLFGHIILRYKLLPNDDKLFQSLDHLPFNGVELTSLPLLIQIRDKL